MTHSPTKEINTLEALPHTTEQKRAASSSPLPVDAPPQDLRLVVWAALSEYNNSEHFVEGLTIQHTLSKITNHLVHASALGIDITEVKITLIKT